MIAGPYSRAPRLCLSLLGPSQYPEAKLLILVLNGCEGQIGALVFVLATGKSLCDHDVEREGQPNGSIEANGFENRLIRGKCIELHGSLEPIKRSEMLRGNMPLQAKVGPWRCLRPACDLGMGCSQRRPLAKVSLFGSDEVTGVKRTCNQWCMLIYNDLYISMISMHLIILISFRTD